MQQEVFFKVINKMSTMEKTSFHKNLEKHEFY